MAGVLMLALGGTRKARGFGKVTCFVGLVYNGVTGFFSDTLSYIRLMALMVSGQRDCPGVQHAGSYLRQRGAVPGDLLAGQYPEPAAEPVGRLRP